MSVLKIAVITGVLLAGLGAASAATVQNGRGTFIQDRNGSWHQYVRVTHRRSLSEAYASADYNGLRQYNSRPQLRSVAYYVADGSMAWAPRRTAVVYYQADVTGQYIFASPARYSASYGNEGYYYGAYVGGPSNQNFGILSEH
jgi:hypothetical protein